ncbi:MAG: hypothetical protein RE468_13160 [Acidithiobacillus caldus]|uniref:tetratricopeptide repeat protein n=1 Tax=Acidithiobacillus caldus TaxID=33059 RepID=UPI002815C797|nr:hypothetical protein [Acidithiobacillus caldus]WMT46808.1 MAG: hypothetical protein RE468_13160 [Acidithiobacillus caldus]
MGKIGQISIVTMVVVFVLSNFPPAIAADAVKVEPAKTKTERSENKAKQAQNIAKKAPGKSSSKEQNAQLDRLAIQARADYWHGNINGAITAYEKLIKEHPQPRWYGELGNIYYQTGRPQLAAKNYYLAEKSLIAEGRPLEAGALLPILQRLDPPLAQELLAQQTRTKEKRK